MEDTEIVFSPTKARPEFKDLEFYVDDDGNVTMAMPPVVVERTGATACVVEPWAFDALCEAVSSRNESGRHNGWGVLGDAPDALVRAGINCFTLGMYFVIYWLEKGEVVNYNSEHKSWDDLQPILSLLPAVQHARLARPAAVSTKDEKAEVYATKTVAIRCWDLHSPETREVVFFVDDDGVATMTITPTVTRRTGATFCTIKASAFDSMCRLIEVRGEYGRRNGWIMLGDSPDMSVRAGFMCKDDGLRFNFHWMHEEELCSDGPDTISWDDLQPILGLKEAAVNARQQVVPTFGLCQA